MKNLLSRRIMSNWATAGWICAVVSVLSTIVGLAAILSANPPRWQAWCILAFGLVGMAAAVMIWRRNRSGLLISSVMYFVMCFALLLWGWKGPQDLVTGIPPFLASLGSYLLYRSPDRMNVEL
ncbi:MAG: hypothetical protein ABL962_04875 [Fimbriimonadaceae bacterium]